MFPGLQRYGEETWTPPFTLPLPSNGAEYAARTSWRKAAWRRALRAVNLARCGQNGLVRTQIDPRVHRRILWIHQGTPQVGDSLMDLAARELLRGRVERLDLLTESHLVPLYRADEVFSLAASDPADLPGPYSLVLLHSAASRSVRDKLAHYRQLPFAHVQGFYTGPEFNRTLFGFYRIAQLLGMPPDARALDTIARPRMGSTTQDEAAIDALGLPGGAIAVALGGVRDWRTYHAWPEVLRALHRAVPQRPVVLLGSDNGLAMRDTLVAAGAGMPLIDRVGRHGLGEVHALLRRCALAICADGGLLHVAHAAEVPVVALFAGDIQPAFRVTAANRTHALYGASSVDDVPAAAVAACAVAALKGAQATSV